MKIPPSIVTLNIASHRRCYLPALLHRLNSPPKYHHLFFLGVMARELLSGRIGNECLTLPTGAGDADGYRKMIALRRLDKSRRGGWSLFGGLINANIYCTASMRHVNDYQVM